MNKFVEELQRRETLLDNEMDTHLTMLDNHRDYDYDQLNEATTGLKLLDAEKYSITKLIILALKEGGNK